MSSWFRSADVLFDEEGKQFRLYRGWGGDAKIVQRQPTGSESVIAEGPEDEIELQFDILAQELGAIDLAVEPEEEEEEETV